MIGTFTGVGVGPGDPELITLKALKAIDDADVIVLPAKDKESCRAYKTAQDAYALLYREIGRDQNDFLKKECLCEPFPMTHDQASLDAFHDRVADRVAGFLESGKNVAVLTIGDPCVYSTFAYVAYRIGKKGYRTDYVSGVTSFCAAAGALGISLAKQSEQIHIIPGSADCKEALSLPGTKIFMKMGKELGELKELIKASEKEKPCEVFGITNAGLSDEAKAHSLSELSEDWGYLTVVVVKDL